MPKASKYFPQFALSWNHDFCAVKPASTMCSNSTCDSHNKLLLYLLNNKVLSYLISANAVSALRTRGGSRIFFIYHIVFFFFFAAYQLN